VTKVENFDKKCLTLSKENQKSPFKHIRFGKSKSPVKGLKRIIIYKLFFLFCACFKGNEFSTFGYTLRKSVLFFVWIEVQYRKSVKSTNHDLFLKKAHFFQIKNIFDSKKRTSLAPLRYWT
jgi:hypothetical protein